jgi:hypothetical protein
LGTCEQNDSKFDYEGIEMICQVCGFMNYSNRYAMNGNVIAMYYAMSISLEKPGNQKAIHEDDIDSVLIRYKQEKEGTKPDPIGGRPIILDQAEWLQ